MTHPIGDARESQRPRGEGFGPLLRAFRRAAGLTQEGLAGRAGVSARAISDLERGLSGAPQRQTVALLTDALGLDAAQRGALEATILRQRARPTAHVARIAMAVAGDAFPVEPAVRRAGGLADLDTLSEPLTRLVGRDEDIIAILEALARPGVRLVTITGVGGVGKTRLALHVARLAAPRFEAGVVVVGLAGVRDPSLVLPTVARSLGLREEGTTSALIQLQAYFAGRVTLLLLDNVEHVLSAAADIVALLGACPGLRLLATSRARLRVGAEHEFPLAPLAVPPPHGRAPYASMRPTMGAATPAAAVKLPMRPEPDVDLDALAGVPAVALFVERVRQVQPRFTLTAANAPAIAHICRLLDGLPLAIELAAARARLFPPHALLDRLDRRLPLLTGGGRDLPDRQRTMRAAIAWSIDLLSAAEQALFQRLGVFAGGATLDAMAAVCAPELRLEGDLLDWLFALLDHGLLIAVAIEQSEGDPTGGGDPRVGMLGTVREYALELLEASGEAAGVRARHAAHYLAVTTVTAAAGQELLTGPEQGAWLERLEREHDNLRAALRWALEGGDSALSARLGGALWLFWYLHGHAVEGLVWLGRIVALISTATGPPVADAVRCPLLYGTALLAWACGDYGRSLAALREAFALSRVIGDRQGLAVCLSIQGLAAFGLGQCREATALLEEALTLWRALGNVAISAIQLTALGTVALWQGDLPRAETVLAESLTLSRQVGDAWAISIALTTLGEVALARGEYGQAERWAEESLTLQRRLGAWGQVAYTLYILATALLSRARDDDGDAIARAAALYEESLELARAAGDTRLVGLVLAGLGTLAETRGDAEAASALFARAVRLFGDLGNPTGGVPALCGQGRLALVGGDRGRARGLYVEGLELARAIGNQAQVSRCLSGLAAVALAEGRATTAARLHGAATALCAAVGAPLPPPERRQDEHTVAAARAALGGDAFATAAAAGRARTVEESISDAHHSPR